MNTRSYLWSVIIAGVVIGFLGNLPVLNFINCFLCIFVWIGGILAVWLYRRFQHGAPGLTVGQGAGIGAIAGVIGVLVGMVVYALTSFITMPMMVSMMRAFQIEGNLPTTADNLGFTFGSTLFFFCIDIILYPIFGALGGLLGAGVFWKEPQAVISPQ
jgi:hypothetical protein